MDLIGSELGALEADLKKCQATLEIIATADAAGAGASSTSSTSGSDSGKSVDRTRAQLAEAAKRVEGLRHGQEKMMSKVPQLYRSALHCVTAAGFATVTRDDTGTGIAEHSHGYIHGYMHCPRDSTIITLCSLPLVHLLV
jgi:hypothetical protein